MIDDQQNQGAYREFVENYLEANSWAARKDGAPVELIDRLTTTQRRAAEEELIKRLGTGDPWFVIGLGHLKSEKAVPALYDLLNRSKGAVKAEVATALWKIRQDDEMLATVLDLTRPSFLSRLSPFSVYNMIDIIHCLARFPHPAARARLEELTHDEEYLIAYNAEYALRLRESHYGINDTKM